MFLSRFSFENSVLANFSNIIHHKQAFKSSGPAVDNCWATGGRGFLSGTFHFLYQLQQGRSFVWGLLVRPGGVPIMLQSALLFLALIHRYIQSERHKCVYVVMKKHKYLIICTQMLFWSELLWKQLNTL